MGEATKVERADIRMADAAAPASDTTTVKVLGWLSETADQPQLISLCAAATVIGLIASNRRLAVTGARALAAELVGTALKSFVKRRVDRTRPHAASGGAGYRMGEGDGDDDTNLNSFPSGHTVGAVAVARAVARTYPEHAAVAYVTAAAVAAIQVPRLKHYPSDLAAGALVGLVADGTIRISEAVAATMGSGPG